MEGNLLASLQRRVQEQAEEIRLLRRKLDFDSRQRADPTATPLVMRVADLYPVPLTRPLLCVPECGLTTVYPLSKEELKMLNMDKRVPCNSFESL